MFVRRPFLIHRTAVLATAFAATVILAIAATTVFAAEPTSSAGATSSEPGRTLNGKVRTVAMEWLNRSGQRPVTKFGITLDESVKQAEVDRPIVFVIHGYNSTPQRVTALSNAISAAGYPCGTFGYPNDQAITQSATLLSQELRRVAKEHPNRKVALVAHSMGGIVAREAIENPTLDPGNVTRLIMISPPSHGTSCAYIACSGDVVEYSSTGNSMLDRLYASFEDGCGEARHDLKPDSPFLKQLNGRPHNSKVRYSIFLGTGTKLSPEQLAHAHSVLEKCAEANRFVRAIEPALRRALDDLNDSVAEGDGVVSVARGRLEGVPDTVLLGFNHWNAIGEPNSAPVQALHREILNRLAPADDAVATAATR